MKMFEFEKKVSGGHMQSYNRMYPSRLVAITANDKVYFTDAVLRAIGNPKFANIGFNGIEWAVAPGEPSEGYKVCSHGAGEGNTKYLSVSKVIKKRKLPVGYIFEGKTQNGMVVFSLTPSDKLAAPV